jgi:hypothetical protein
VSSTLTVNPAALTVTADNQTKAYGAANPTLTVSYSGFVNGDTAASLTTPPTVSTTATTASPVGTYPITASGAVSANYTISYVSGTLTITAVSQGPVAVNDSYTTTQSTALTVAAPGVLANDTGNALTAVFAGAPAHGTLTLNANGGFRYTPSAAFTGTDRFRYQAKDAAGALSNIATVTITVTQFSAGLIAPVTIIAVADVLVSTNDAYTTNEAVALEVAAPGLPANDTDFDSDSLTAVVAEAQSASVPIAPALPIRSGSREDPNTAGSDPERLNSPSR